MSKHIEIDMEDSETLCNVGKAISSPIRIEILKLLYENGMIIGDIAKKLDIPASSAAMHVKIFGKSQPDTYGRTGRGQEVLQNSVIEKWII